MLAPPAYHLCTCRRLREVAKTKSLTNTCIETVAYRCSLITMELHRCVEFPLFFFSKFQVEKFQNARDFFSSRYTVKFIPSFSIRNDYDYLAVFPIPTAV